MQISGFNPQISSSNIYADKHDAEISAKTEEAGISAAEQNDTCEITNSEEADKECGKLKKFAQKAKALIKEASDSPITFVKDHKKSVPITVGAAAVGTAAAAFAILDSEQLSDVKDMAELAVLKSGAKSRITLYSKAAEFIGASAGAGCLIGGGATIIKGVVKTAAGIAKTVKGAKKKDAEKTARGARTTVAGLKKTIKGSVITAAGAGGALTEASKFANKVFMPPLRAATSVLNTGIGAKTLIKGIKNKNKKDIASGALDLAYGTAAGAALIIGGPTASAVSTAIFTAREVFSAVKTAAKFINKDKQIQQQRREEAQKQEQIKDNKAEASEIK